MKKHILLTAWMTGAAALAAPASQPLTAAPQQQTLQNVRKQIDSLQKDLASKQEVKKQAQSAIQASEEAIRQTDAALQQLGKQKNTTARQLQDLQDALESVRHQVAASRQQVARMLKSQYRNGSHDAMRLMLNASDPNQTSRDLVYYRHIAEAQQQLVSDLNLRQTQLESLSRQIEEHLSRLGNLSKRKSTEKVQLQEDKADKVQQLNTLASQIRDRETRLAQLKQDEKRLTDLIAQINREIRRQQEIANRKAQERRLAAQKENERRKRIADNARKQGKPVPAEAQKQVEVDAVADSSAAGKAFRSLQGHMRMPVSGTIAGKFGTLRSEGTSWKGLFIQTPRGTPVRAVADGRVVYADPLRGFGNALILDHGGNYLTVYTGLSAIGRGIGDTVKAGDSIGSSGTLDSGETGLYFEIRYLGRPVNPETWAH